MSTTHLIAITAQIDSFPALPTTVSKVLATSANPEATATDLMKAVITDQSMCATILKVANSVLFGMPRKVSTIERAVVVLGHDEIRNIAIGKALFSSFPKLAPEYQATVSLFWEHAFTCGLAAKIIAEHFHFSASEFFIAGLIHDIGKLAMFTTFPSEYPLLREVSNPTHFFQDGNEASQFGIDHNEVGKRLVDRWMLPKKLVMAVGFHHRPEQAPEHINHPLIVQVADILSLLYCCSGVEKGRDIETIFQDFLPEIQNLWAKQDLPLVGGNLGQWFERLLANRQQEEDLFGLFSD
jgi:HD-like signal output (HDOD) protein